MDFMFWVAWSLFLFNSTQAFARGVNFRQHPQSLEFPKARRLVAAFQTSKVEARHELSPIRLDTRASFDYLHEDDEHPDSVFAATLDVQSKLPVLVLEDIEVGLENLTCSGSQIQLSFTSTGKGTELKKAVQDLDEFVLVTSHEGCDPDGERSTHRVTNFDFNYNNQVVMLDKVASTWQEAFPATSVSFSRQRRSTIRKRMHTLTRRQQSPPETTTSESVEAEMPSPTVSFPTPSVTTGVRSDATTSLDKHYVDEKLFPPEFPGADMVIPQGVTVSCKNCSLEGDIELTKGSFNLTGTDFKDIQAFFQHGSVEVMAKDLFAQIELGVDLTLNQPLASLNMSLPAIPLIPFAIPGALVFGPMLEPQFTVSLDYIGEFGFSYGFNLSIPDNAKIEINMAEFANSSMIGSGFISGGIGAFLNLPKLSLNASQLSDVDERCEPVSNEGNGREGEATSTLDNIFSSLTNLVPSVEVDMGVLADFEVDVPGLDERLAIESVLASTSYPLPTACLQFDSKNKRYSPPQVISAAAGGDTPSEKSDKGKESHSSRIEAKTEISVVLGVVIAMAGVILHC
ncbi:hypothetical protein FE257_006416 [Aspergillus nanangensis]|uniref:GPI anchored protein n=1 Tax=Aspergillus nanangensis TaxID=2582783 RepID=A0AAD4CXY5_ASPNN|nr:hypothetical protein FE257_006416 [Aspergillus nanangensis]